MLTFLVDAELLTVVQPGMETEHRNGAYLVGT